MAGISGNTANITSPTGVTVASGVTVPSGVSLATGFTPTSLPSLQGWWQAGSGAISDGAASFNGTATNNLTSAVSTPFRTGSAMTVCGWAYVNAIGAQQYIVAKDDVGSNREWFIEILSSGVVRFIVSNGGSFPSASSAAVTGATWFFYCATYDGTNQTISINNGTPVSTVTGITPTQGTATLRFGSRADATLGLTGRQDAWGFWNRVLTAGEITQLYNAGAGRNYSGLTGSLLTNLVAYYNMDEASGNRSDKSGNGYTLTQNGTVGFAAGIVSGTAQEGDPVSLWVANNGATLTAISAAARPTWRAGGGKPYLQFDGTDDGMVSTITPSGATTIAFGASQTGSGSIRIVNSAAPVNGLMSLTRVSIKSYCDTNIIDNGTAYSGARSSIISKASGGNWAGYIDGVDTTTAFSNTANWGLIGLGAAGLFAEPANANISDFVVTGAQLTAAQVALLSPFLKDRAT